MPDFATVKALEIPQGNAKQIAKDGTVLWKKQTDENLWDGHLRTRNTTLEVTNLSQPRSYSVLEYYTRSSRNGYVYSNFAVIHSVVSRTRVETAADTDWYGVIFPFSLDGDTTYQISNSSKEGEDGATPYFGISFADDNWVHYDFNQFVGSGATYNFTTPSNGRIIVFLSSDMKYKIVAVNDIVLKKV